MRARKCPNCGHFEDKAHDRCGRCGSFFPGIYQLIAEEETYEHTHSLKGRLEKIRQADNFKAALLAEWGAFKDSLGWQGKLALWVAFAFVFALIITVL